MDITNHEEENSEILLKENLNRFTSFPIYYQDIYNASLKHKETIWLSEEVDLSSDLKDWAKLDEDEKFFIKHILAFFAASDGIVNENLVTQFYDEIKIPEVRSFYAVQIFIENEHSIMYSKLIETYVLDHTEKNTLFNAINTFPIIKEKANWAIKWINDTDNFAIRLIAFAIVEGIFFSGAFCSIYWINEKKILPGLTLSNSYIARDEALHTLFAILLYTKYITNKVPEEMVHNIIKEAVDIEKKFINEALPCSLIGMNAQMMSEYIEFCADRLSEQLGYSNIYEATCPFEFMESICLSSSTNFFDTRSSDYKKKISSPSQNKKIELSNDF